MLLSDVWRLSVAYIGNNSRIERHRKTKIGAQIAHVTRDSDTTFKDRQLQRSAWERIERGKLLLRCRLQARRSARRRKALRRPHGEERGGGISCRHAHSLLMRSGVLSPRVLFRAFDTVNSFLKFV